jgi:hypothetical protein
MFFVTDLLWLAARCSRWRSSLPTPCALLSALRAIVPNWARLVRLAAALESPFAAAKIV